MIKVLCGGRFNFFHEGHKYFLMEAKKHGDYLIVVVAHDEHNGKRADREPAETRKRGVEESCIADEVVVGDPQDFYIIVQKYRPQVIVLGWDQTLPFPESKLAGIKVVKVDRLQYYNNSRP